MRMNRIVAISVLVLVATSVMAQAQEDNKAVLGVYGQAEQFALTQPTEDVNEKGMIYGVGLTFWQLLDSGLELDALLELFTGTVEHEGDAQIPGIRSPSHKSQSSYGGCKIEAIVGYCLTQGQPLRLSTQLGLGTRMWSHQLDVSDNGDLGNYGYTEKWATYYAILGLQAREALGPRQELIVRAQYRIPIINTETVDLSNVGGPYDISLTPGNAASFYADAGMRIGTLHVCAFIETLNFTAATSKLYQRYSQPESAATMIGGKVTLMY